MTHTIVDGKVKLFKRPRSSYWQVAFRMGGHTVRQSTKTEDLAEAKEVAMELYLEARILHKKGIPTVSKSFKSVAEFTVKQLQKSIDAGGKVTYKDYIRNINKYLIPFFGNKAITSIDGEALAAFAQYRELQLGRPASWGLINMHNCALNRIFDTAVDRRFMSRSQVPEMKNNGVKGERRPTFELDEYKHLYEHMRVWIKQGLNGLARDRRELLREYIFFVTCTGCRPGTELEGLKWKHIQLITDKKTGVEYVQIYVKGKTGERYLIARHAIRRYLTRLAKRNPAFEGVTLEKVIAAKSDEIVFRTQNGKEVTGFENIFKKLLISADLLNDPMTGQPRVLYSLRHLYITSALRKEVSVWTIANNCGTSVEMIKKHYSHVTNAMLAKTLAGRSMN